MSSTKDKDNLSQPLFIVEKTDIGLEDCGALHAHTRQAEQVIQNLKAQKDSVKPKENKK
ncbi:hypothetical protein JCM14076_22630 [Methylosoma difficile]